MEFYIDVYRRSGKWYTREKIREKENMRMYEKRFLRFLLSNLPAIIEDGYVVISSTENDEGFHYGLYKYSELKEEAYGTSD